MENASLKLKTASILLLQMRKLPGIQKSSEFLFYTIFFFRNFFRGKVHMDRRMFLRTALRELELVLTDQPGLLGPKVKKFLHFLKYRIGIVTIYLFFLF